jgi:hypothetical protein
VRGRGMRRWLFVLTLGIVALGIGYAIVIGALAQ